MSVLDIILKQTAPGFYRDRPEWVFNRRALRRELIGSPDNLNDTGNAAFLQAVPTAREVKDIDPDSVTYLVKFPYESDQAYAQRFALAFDGGEAYRVLSEFIGHILRPGYSLNLDGFSDEIRERIEKNFDGEGTDFKSFLADVVYEIAGLGRGVFLTYTDDDDGQPVTCILPRENVRDCERYGDELEYIIFDKCFDRAEGIARDDKLYRVLITPDQWVFVDPKAREIVQSGDGLNPLGVVPVVDVWYGAEGKSLVGAVARIQFLLLNSESVLAQKVRNQGIAILNGPTGIRDQLGTLSAQKVVEIAPDSSRGLEWAAYPASSLDGDYKYLQMLAERMVNLSATRSHYEAANQSGESKLWDFLTQKSVLESIATATENAVNQILSHWERYTLAPVVEKRFSLNRNYDARDLKSTLELIFQAMSLTLGDTVERKLKETARDALKSVGVNLSPDELTASDAELDAAAEAKANLDALTADVKAMSRRAPAESEPVETDDADEMPLNTKTKK
ncbi:MAG: hypothetical protein IPJ01_12080 [Micavibrio sp.]|nr:hypothetical protein [Micavibrio sp.]